MQEQEEIRTKIHGMKKGINRTEKMTTRKNVVIIAMKMAIEDKQSLKWDERIF